MNTWNLMYLTILRNIKRKQFRRISSCQNQNMTWKQDIKVKLAIFRRNLYIMNVLKNIWCIYDVEITSKYSKFYVNILFSSHILILTRWYSLEFRNCFRSINTWNGNFQDSFKTRNRLFISAFSICMTAPLKVTLVSWG